MSTRRVYLDPLPSPDAIFINPDICTTSAQGQHYNSKRGQNKLVWGVSCMLPLLPLTLHHSHSHPYPALSLTRTHARILQKRAAPPSGLTDICPERLKRSDVLAEDLEKSGKSVSIGRRTYPVWQPWRPATNGDAGDAFIALINTRQDAGHPVASSYLVPSNCSSSILYNAHDHDYKSYA